MGYATEANYCALALAITKKDLTPEEACAKMVVPMTGKRKMTTADQELISELLAQGTTYREIAGLFGKTERAIQKMVQYRTKKERTEQNAGA